MPVSPKPNRRQSAGLLLYRGQGYGGQGFRPDAHAPGEPLEVLLVHPGGPFWKKKDHGAWTIPKGEFTPDESPLAAAQREFQEETGFALAAIAHAAPDGVDDRAYLDLGTVAQAGGKTVHAFAVAGNCDPALLVSNTFPLEWPPRSGRLVDTPEIDRAAWFTLDAARQRILPAQAAFLDRLTEMLRS